MKTRHLYILALASGLLFAGCSESKTDNPPEQQKPGTPATTCDGIDLQTSADNCGTCGHKCSEHQKCTGGFCGCADGWYNCDKDAAGTCESNVACSSQNECDADKMTSNAHCGECNHACVNAQCTSGSCVCNTGRDDCDGDGNCECLHGKCQEGQCVPDEGWYDCDGNGSFETHRECPCHKDDKQPCYTGNTTDVRGETKDANGNVTVKHRCQEGYHKCIIDDIVGAHWSSACHNEVHPTNIYKCDDPLLDQDCDGIPESQQDADNDGHTICKDGALDDCCDNVEQCSNLQAEHLGLVHPDQEDCQGNEFDDNCNGQIDEGTKECGEQTVIVDNTCKIKNRTCDNGLPKGTDAEWATAVSESTTTKAQSAAWKLFRAMDMCMDVGTAEDLGDDGGIIEFTLHKSGDPSKAIHSSQVNFLPGMRNKEGVDLVKSRVGDNIVLLSSGDARDVYSGVETKSTKYDIDNGGNDVCNDNAVPEVFLQGGYSSTSGCSNDLSKICDSAVLHLKLKAPKTAKGFSFDFRFFSREYPFYVCSQFNDFFLAILTDESGQPLIDINKDGHLDDENGNIAFDIMNNPLSVNNAFFTVCASPSCGDYDAYGVLWDLYEKEYLNQFLDEATAEAEWYKDHGSMCPDNLACENKLCGTCDKYQTHKELEAYYPIVYKGYTTSDLPRSDEKGPKGGATAWLTTQAPVEGGQVFNLDFYIWDTGDTKFDSTVILDNFQWKCEEVTVKTDFAKPVEQVN